MYSMSHQPVSASLNGGGGSIGSGIMDGSGTINPAALNSSGLINPTQAVAPQSSPRGLKRSRTPDEYGDANIPAQDDRSKKRGRAHKDTDSSPSTQKHANVTSHPVAGPVRTPQLKTQSLPQTSPTQASPPKATPTKAAVLKALPTVRDHTTDQLTEEGDEYIPREYDDEGEKKVSANGTPLNGRTYKCRTFLVPNRGDKLFMLATECARVLGYRDSYLLFNKNRSLFKIIATQAEKDDLIHQDVLPYSYRSRQIAIVTARSMFRQFGSRLITGGRRVRDDYWEAKARKQGFTEEDLAGEKRPGAAKQREAQAAEASATHQLTALPHGEIIYSNGPGSHLDTHTIGGFNPTTLAPLPMINSAPTDDVKRDYSNINRPRHEISGVQPYQDRTIPSTQTDILNQSAQAADYNRGLNQQRGPRENYMTEYWKRPQEVPESPQRSGTADGETVVPASQNIQSPHTVPASTASATQQSASSRPSASSHMLNNPGYSQPTHGQTAMQTPMHPMHTPMRPDHMPHRSPSMGLGGAGAHAQQPSYGYSNNQVWPPQQPQPSPLGQHHNMQQYNQPAQQQSPHPQQPQLHHQSPQMHHAQSTSSMHGASMGYPTMGGMSAPGYPGMGRSPYQPGANPQQFMHQTSTAQQPGSQGWAPPPQQQQQQQHHQPQQPGQWSGF